MATTTVTRPKLSTAVRAPNEVPVQDLMVSAISGTTISQAVKQQQSLALVQIMLHASLGTLFYLRELLPLSCFGDCDLRAISTSDSSLSYEEFLGGHLKPPVETGGRGQPLKVILRNLNEKADRILDLLEHGIFEALEKNCLEAVQLTIFVDKEHPSHVVESYTFSFSYAEDFNQTQRRITAVSIRANGSTSEPIIFRTVKYGLEMIIRRLICLSTFLPVLPNKRFLEIHLFYTEGCPQDFEPQGFQAAAHTPLYYPGNEGWKKETQSCGTMDTGLHSVGLNVTSLKCTVGECENDAGEIQIPESLEYTDEVVRGYEIGFENQEVQESTSEALPPGEAISQISTQTRRDAEARIILENMLSSRLEDSQLVPTQVQPCSSPELVETNCKYKASLSSFKVSQIQGNGLLARTASAAGLASDACKARCQCGNDELDVDMLQCSFCNTKQHLICYGFLHPNDQRIPATHACYKCLLEPEEFSIMKQMYTLVLLRKAIKIINDEGYPNQIKDFAQKMHCSGQTIVQVIGVLKKKKLISATPGSKSRGFAAKKLPKFSIPASEEVKKILRQEIFNPLAKISHHYNICPISEESPPENCAPEAPITDTSARRDRHFSSTLDKDKGSQGRKHGPSTSPPSSPPRSQHHQPMVERELLNTSTVEVARTPSVCFVTTQNNSTMQENQRYKRRKLSNAGNPMSFDDPMD